MAVFTEACCLFTDTDSEIELIEEYTEAELIEMDRKKQFQDNDPFLFDDSDENTTTPPPRMGGRYNEVLLFYLFIFF